MDLPSIARSMRSRMPWSVGQLVLHGNEVDRGRGWDRTVNHLSAANSPFQTKTNDLAASLKEHLLCGEKLTRFYYLEDAEIDILWDAIKDAQIEDTAFKQSYPLTLTEEELSSQPLQMQLTAVEENEFGLAAIFSSVRTLTLRVELERDSMSDEVSEALSDFDEIYAVKHTKIHAADVLWIPSTGNYVDVRVDYPLGMLRQTGEFAQGLIKDIANNLAGHSLLQAPENLFPIMSSMYNASNEGIVTELAFGTTSASLKHEKMRRNRSCLRQEVYHVGGKAALATDIEPYKLSIRYKRPVDENRNSLPELNLHSSVRSANGRAPTLTDAVIRRCAGLEDFELVRSRVEHFLALHRAAG